MGQRTRNDRTPLKVRAILAQWFARRYDSLRVVYEKPRTTAGVEEPRVVEASLHRDMKRAFKKRHRK